MVHLAELASGKIEAIGEEGNFQRRGASLARAEIEKMPVSSQ